MPTRQASKSFCCPRSSHEQQLLVALVSARRWCMLCRI